MTPLLWVGAAVAAAWWLRPAGATPAPAPPPPAVTAVPKGQGVASVSRGYAHTADVRASNRAGTTGGRSVADWHAADELASSTSTTGDSGRVEQLDSLRANGRGAVADWLQGGGYDYIAQHPVGGITDPEAQLTAAAPAPEYDSSKHEALADTRFFGREY